MSSDDFFNKRKTHHLPNERQFEASAIAHKLQNEFNATVEKVVKASGYLVRAKLADAKITKEATKRTRSRIWSIFDE